MILAWGQLKAQSWKELNDSLSYYYEHSHFIKAVPVARKIVEMAKTENGEMSEGYATALNNLAYMLNKTGDKKAAGDNYLESLTIRLKILEPDHDDCLSIVQSLGIIYTESGNREDALSVYSGYLKQLEKKGKQKTQAYIMVLYRRAALLFETGWREEAKKDLLVIAASGEPMLADTAVYYNTYDYLVQLFTEEINITAAEHFFLRHVEFCQWVDGDGSEPHIYALYKLAALYGRGKDYERSMAVIQKVMAGYRSLAGKESPQYITAAMNHVTLLAKLGKQEALEEALNELTEACRKKYGSTSREFANILQQAALSVLQGGLIQKGNEYLERSIETTRKLNDPVLLASKLNTLDSAYKDQEKAEEREALLTEILSLQEKYHFLSDSAWSEHILSLCGVFVTLKDHARAAALAEKFDSVSQRFISGDNAAYLSNRRDAAYLFSLVERFDKAERYYLEAMRVAALIWKDDSDNYAKLLRNLGSMYRDAGQLQKALTLLKRSAEILEKSDPVPYDLLADIYYKLSGCYERRAVVTDEEAYLKKAILVAEKIKDGLTYSTFLARRLAQYYESGKRYAMADSMHQEVRKRINMPGHRLYGAYLSTLAQQGVNYVNWGYPEKAAACIKEAIEGSRVFYSDSALWDHELVLFLCEYYRVTKQFKEAAALGKQMLQVQKRILGDDSPVLASTLIILSRLYFESGEYKEAEKVISLLNKVTLSSMLKNFDVFSDSEKEKYIANKFNAQFFSNTLLLRHRKVSGEFVSETFEQTLLLKSLILSENRKITEAVLQTADTSLQRLYGDWLSARQALAREYSKPARLRQAGLAAQEERADNLQKAITSRSSGLLGKQNSAMLSTADIRKNLAADEAVIEFVNFGVFRDGADSALYAAFVLRRNSQSPVFVPLCERKQLQKLFDSAGTTATSMVSKFYRGTELKNRSAAAALGKELYDLIWAPLEPHLEGIRKINYSPAGKLYSIAFHSLPVDSSRMLMDKYVLNQYSSTRQVALRKEEEKSKAQSIALFGDAAFTMDSTAIVKIKPGNTSHIYSPPNRGARGGAWVDLPGTAEEVRRVKELFDRNNISTKIFTRATATEDNLKALSGNSPIILHIATHGFFLPEPDKAKKENNLQQENTYSLADDPLLRSGLILTGGNHAWSGKTPVDGVEDGIATAYEISQLNLSNTELVVLSACETALGDIKGNEGVFGLQRAFKMAGVKKMIVSLWQVPDQETAELMTAFYSYWLKGRKIEEAFAQAQADMRKKYPPYYWAAFVLIQ